MAINKLLHQPQYRPDIDGLRALCVLAVVIYHGFPNRLTGGFLGVDVFFVISGYLISSIILNDLSKNTFSIARFYSRRIKRIIPALSLVLVAAIVFGWFSLLSDEYSQLGKHVAASAGFIANFAFWDEAGYFDDSSDKKPLLHLWSLGVEEQFYIVWPLLVWICARIRNGLWIIFLMALVSLLLSIGNFNNDSAERFYAPWTRFWELASGGLLAFYMTNSRLKAPNTRTYYAESQSIYFHLASILGLSMIIIGFIKYDRHDINAIWCQITSVMGAVLILYSGKTSLANRLLSKRLAVWFGLISYPLYLWHWPILSFATIVERGLPGRGVRLTAILSSILLAWITYRFVELKIRYSISRRSSVYLMVTLITVGFLGLSIYRHSGYPERYAVTHSDMTIKARDQFMGPLWKYTQNEACMRDYPYEGAKELAWWFCMKSSTKPPTIILLGNSFANQLYPGFINNPALHAHTILSIGDCDFGAIFVESLDQDIFSPCQGQRGSGQASFIDTIIRTTPSLKLAVIDGLDSHPDSEYIKRVVTRVKNIEATGMSVIIFMPHLRPGFHPKSCFKTPLKDEPRDCTFDSGDRAILNKGFENLIEVVKKETKSVKFFDQNQIFCDYDSNHCSWIKDGMPLLRDELHLSEYASIFLQKEFTNWARVEMNVLLDAADTGR